MMEVVNALIIRSLQNANKGYTFMILQSFVFSVVIDVSVPRLMCGSTIKVDVCSSQLIMAKLNVNSNVPDFSTIYPVTAYSAIPVDIMHAFHKPKAREYCHRMKQITRMYVKKVLTIQRVTNLLKTIFQSLVTFLALSDIKLGN